MFAFLFCFLLRRWISILMLCISQNLLPLMFVIYAQLSLSYLLISLWPSQLTHSLTYSFTQTFPLPSQARSLICLRELTFTAVDVYRYCFHCQLNLAWVGSIWICCAFPALPLSLSLLGTIIKFYCYSNGFLRSFICVALTFALKWILKKLAALKILLTKIIYVQAMTVSVIEVHWESWLTH